MHNIFTQNTSKIDLGVMKNTFFNRMVFQGQKDIFQNWLRAAPLYQLNQTYRFIMLDQKGNFFFIKTYFKQFWLVKQVWAKSPDWPLWTKSSAKKEDFRLKSDLIWQNPFLKLWKLKFIIIKSGSIIYIHENMDFFRRWSRITLYHIGTPYLTCFSTLILCSFQR